MKQIMIRKEQIQNMKCPFVIRVRLTKCGQKLFVKEMSGEHNHWIIEKKSCKSEREESSSSQQKASCESENSSSSQQKASCESENSSSSQQKAFCESINSSSSQQKASCDSENSYSSCKSKTEQNASHRTKLLLRKHLLCDQTGSVPSPPQQDNSHPSQTVPALTQIQPKLPQSVSVLSFMIPIAPCSSSSSTLESGHSEAKILILPQSSPSSIGESGHSEAKIPIAPHSSSSFTREPGQSEVEIEEGAELEGGVVWKSWKEKYLSISSRLKCLQQLNNLNFDLIELSLDFENFPETRNEWDKLRQLLTSALTTQQVDHNDFDPALLDFSAKMKYLDEELYELFSILTDQELEKAFQWFLDTEMSHAFTFPKLLVRLNAVKDIYDRTHREKRVDLGNEDTNDLENEDSNFFVLSNETEELRNVIKTEGQASENDPIQTYTVSVDPPSLAICRVEEDVRTVSSPQDDDVDEDLSEEDLATTNNSLPLENVDENLPEEKQHALPGNSDAATEADQPMTLDDIVIETEENLGVALQRMSFHRIPSIKRRVTCPVCRKEVLRKVIRGHMRVKHSIRRRQIIESVGNNFQTEEDLVVLLRETRGKNIITCPICQKSISRFGLKHHIRIRHWEKKLQCLCNICGGVFSAKDSLRKHLKTHEENRKLHMCDKCPRTFVDRRAFSKHKSNHARSNPHNDGKVHACSLCPKRYADSSGLRRHFRSHTNEKPKPYSCNTCSDRFVTQGGLNLHVKYKHSGLAANANSNSTNAVCKYSYACPACTQTYHHRRRHLMAFHILKHAADLTQCVLCDLTFDSTPDLHTHVTEVHLEDKPFECQTCGEKFFTDHRLRMHRQLHSKKGDITLFPCSSCDKTFINNSNLQTHMKAIHHPVPLKCEFCDKTFNWAATLGKHRRSHLEEKWFQCNVCKKKFPTSFRLNSHMCTPMPAKQFPCEFCDKGYCHKKDLLRHVKTKHPSLDNTNTNAERPLVSGIVT